MQGWDHMRMLLYKGGVEVQKVGALQPHVARLTARRHRSLV